MTTSSRNYNILALRGADVDDMEYVEMFGLDPELAYKPELNTAMLDKVYKENIEFGMDEAKAKKLRMNAEKDLMKLLK